MMVTLQPSEESANRGQRLVWHSRHRLCLPALAPKTATAGAAVPHTSHSAEVLRMMKRSAALLAVAMLMASVAWAGAKELVLYLRFDEGHGTRADDAAAGLCQGRLASGVEWVAGHSGKGVKFDGELGSDVSLPLSARWFSEHLDGLTVMMWAKSSGKHSAIFFGSQRPSNARLYLAVGMDGCWSMGIADKPWGTGYKGTRVRADAGWHHVAMTLDGAKATLWLDGKPIGEKAYRPYATAAPPVLGALGGTTNASATFDGTLDELAVYQGVLTAAEIKQAMGGVATTALFRTKHAKFAAFLQQRKAARAALVGHWAFDGDDTAKALDSGPHALHGTVHDTDRAAGLDHTALRCWARLKGGHVEVPAHEALGGWPAMTFEAWVKWDPRGPNLVALASKGYTEQFAIYMHRYSRRIHVALATDKARLNVRTPARLPVYAWAHVVLTWDSRTQQAVVYVDGKPRWKAALAGTAIRRAAGPLLIGGNRGSGEPALGDFAGLIDDVRLYRTVVSPEFVAASHTRLAHLAQADAGTKGVCPTPRLKPLEETCLDPKTKALTYPVYQWPAPREGQKVLSVADFPSIQAAIDALPPSGGMVMVPAGVWKIAKPIVLRSAVSLVGVGESSVIVNTNQQGGNAIEITENQRYRPPSHYHGATGNHGVVVARLQVRGNPKSGHGIALYHSDHASVEGCWLHFNGKTGLHLSDGEENLVVRGVVSKWNGEHGMYIEGCHDTFITASHFEENRLDGIHVQKDNIQAGIVGCNAEDNGRFGVYNKGRWTQVVASQADSNQGGAFIFIGPESEYGTVVSGCAGGAVRAVGAYNVSISAHYGGVSLSQCHSCTVTGCTTGSIWLRDGCRLNTVGSNSVPAITLANDCHDNAVTGNVCRGALRADPKRNVVANNVTPPARETE